MNESSPQILNESQASYSTPVSSSFPLSGSDEEYAASRARIFLVDDNQEMRELLEPFLSARWNVEFFADGASALEAARRTQPDLIVSDVRMPGLNGFELLRHVRTDPRTREIPVVLISSRVGEQALIEALEAQADDYVEKPFSIDALLSRVASRLELSKLRREMIVREKQIRARAEADRQEVVEQMEAFCYTVAHDLRAPLRAMQGFSQALLEDYAGQLDDTAKNYASRIVAAAQRLDTLIQDLLAYSRLTRAELGFGQVSLEAIVQSLLSTFAQEIRTKEAIVDVKRPLPFVMGHTFTVQQLLGNLLSNALKFVAQGVQPRVGIFAEETDQTVRVWIEDNGIGISPQHQERIFRVFERLHPIDTYPGTGIGLAIVRKGAERMGGSSGVRSELGQGSKFWIELKKCPAAAGKTPATPPISKTASA